MNNNIKLSKTIKYSLFSCLLIVAMLCVSHIIGSTPLVMICLICFIALSLFCAANKLTMPILLFFLPWAPLLKIQQGTTSFFTIALILVCLIRFIYNKYRINIVLFISAAMVLFVTFISKSIDRLGIDNSYILFIILLFLFPALLKEINQKYDYYILVCFFTIGIITAALSAQQLVQYPNIAQFIDVYTFKKVTRLSGYYGDSNFYSAHITAALSGVLLLILKETEKIKKIFLSILAIILLYCGFLSGSKSFLIVFICIFVCWILGILFTKGKISSKMATFFSLIIIGIFVLASTIFTEVIDIVMIRFSQSEDLSSFTTGRIDIWDNYLTTLWEDIKLLVLGKGFSNINLQNRASHNTLIQLIYQFGIIGMIFMVTWIWFFIKKAFQSCRVKNNNIFTILTLIFGVFGPWMAIDIFFFDELFLMLFYFCYAVGYFSQKGDELIN